MIGVVDYAAGNVRNVHAALERLGAPWKPVLGPDDFDGVEGIFLPGVGRFGAAMERLDGHGLAGPLRDHAASGRPFLGICAGMQVLFEASEEDPGAAGLGVLPGTVRRVEARPLPHIGWAPVEAVPGLSASADRPFHAYFAHSYAAREAPDGFLAARALAPAAFVAAVRRERLRAMQFHPEKSGALGQALIADFVRDALPGWSPRAAEAGAAESSAAKPLPAPSRRPRRIIPCLDVRAGRVVKGVRFRNLRDAGDPVERAAVYDRDGADEVCFLDVSASVEERRPLAGLVRKVADVLTVPFSVGGGIRTIDEMRRLLHAGADRVSLGTAAVEEPGLVAEAAGAFGSQFVIVSIDARSDGGRWVVTTHGGRRPTGRDAVEWAREVERRGAGEILLNAMDADGTRAGYAVEFTRRIAEAVEIPVIASGGAGGPEDMARVLKDGGADAALAASIFHDGTISIRDAKRRIAAEGVEVRP